MKKVIGIFAICLFALTLSGCVAISPIDDMFTLPQLPNEYFELQEAIEVELDAGAEYSAPTSGANRSAVQFLDIDGDGEKEAVAYFKVYNDDKPLKICIFERDSEGVYAKSMVIENAGTSIESVSYTDMDMDGISEVVVGWQISGELKILYIYSIEGMQTAPLVSTEYTTYTSHQLHSENGTDIVVIKTAGTNETGEVTAYSLAQDGEITSDTAYLSKGIIALSRVRANYLTDGKPAIYVESTTGNNIVTDIITYKSGHLENVTLDTNTGVSETTLRSYSVYSTDINADEIIEVPKPELLPSQTETTTDYYILKWYTYDERGARTLTFTTYHNYSDGWYIRLPEEWVGNISVRRVDGYSGERVIVFSLLKGNGEFEDFLKIYTLTGNNRYEKAGQEGRFIIRNDDSTNGTIYAGEILTETEDFVIPVSVEDILLNFKIIYSEWITGEI